MKYSPNILLLFMSIVLSACGGGGGGGGSNDTAGAANLETPSVLYIERLQIGEAERIELVYEVTEAEDLNGAARGSALYAVDAEGEYQSLLVELNDGTQKIVNPTCIKDVNENFFVMGNVYGHIEDRYIDFSRYAENPHFDLETDYEMDGDVFKTKRERRSYIVNKKTGKVYPIEEAHCSNIFTYQNIWTLPKDKVIFSGVELAEKDEYGIGAIDILVDFSNPNHLTAHKFTMPGVYLANGQKGSLIFMENDGLIGYLDDKFHILEDDVVIQEYDKDSDVLGYNFVREAYDWDDENQYVRTLDGNYFRRFLAGENGIADERIYRIDMSRDGLSSTLMSEESYSSTRTVFTNSIQARYPNSDMFITSDCDLLAYDGNSIINQGRILPPDVVAEADKFGCYVSPGPYRGGFGTPAVSFFEPLVFDGYVFIRMTVDRADGFKRYFLIFYNPLTDDVMLADLGEFDLGRYWVKENDSRDIHVRRFLAFHPIGAGRVLYENAWDPEANEYVDLEFNVIDKTQTSVPKPDTGFVTVTIAEM